MQIEPYLRQIENTFVNLWLIVEPDGLTLVDTGLARSGPKKVLAEIAAIGRQPADLKRILITHTDADHTGGAAELKRLTGARIYARGVEADAMRAGTTSRKPANAAMRAIFGALGALVMPTPAVIADETLVDGQILTILGGLEVLATPGHTPGHTSFYSAGKRLLIAGDSFRATGGKLSFDPAPVHWNYTIGLTSCRKQATLGAALVCCGHGPALRNPEFPRAG